MVSHKLSIAIVAAAFMSACVSSAKSATVWNESVNGDLSGDYADPTDVVLASGTNSLFHTFGQPDNGPMDQDYIHVHIPAGRKLTHLKLQSYVGDDSLAFIAVQAGAAMTFSAEQAGEKFDEILGLSHFGPGEGDEPGDDILARMGAQGAIGFTPPLPGRDYSFWMQQLTGLTTVQFDFIVSNLVAGDFNLDGTRNNSDVESMLEALTDLDKFTTDNGLSPADLLAIGDLDSSGGVTNGDIQPLLNLLSGGGSIAPVPEPNSVALGLLAIASSMTLRCWRIKKPLASF